MLKGKSVLDAAQSMVNDKSATTRTNMLIWLNMAVQVVAMETDWFFLIATQNDAPIVGGIISTPSDFLRMLHVTDGSTWGVNDGSMLTPEEATITDIDGGSTPVGYVIENGAIVLKPAPGDGTAKLVYIKNPTDFVDDATTDSVWPDIFKPLFVRALLSAYYEFDIDQRQLPAMKLDDTLLHKCKVFNNKHRAMPKYGTTIR